MAALRPKHVIYKTKWVLFYNSIIFANLKFNEFIMRDLNTTVSNIKYAHDFFEVSFIHRSTLAWYTVHIQ